MKTEKQNYYLKKFVLLPLVVLSTLIIWLIPTSALGVDGLTILQQRTLAIFFFAALMWMFELIPAWATSVSTIVLLLLAVSNKGFVTALEEGGWAEGAAVSHRDLMAAFADPIIMLFLGGFVLAFAANKVGLDTYLAKTLLHLFGSKPRNVLLGFLLIIGFFSMFMSNTATAAMMLAFLAPVLKTLPENGGGRISLAMSIPIAANIGGIGTPIGTPPNAIALGQLSQLGINIGFGSWMMHMVPFVVVMLLFAWVLLMLLFPFKAKTIEIHIEDTKKHDADFWIVSVTFAATILLWVTSEWTGLDSNVVALIPFAVFAITGVFKHDDFAKIDWHVLWMVAGGFALGTALNKTGLATTLIASIPFASWSALAVMIAAGLIIYLLSTFISNSSAANLLMPILAVVGTAMGENIASLGGIGSMLCYVALAASLAMTLPISTPPNAIACSTGLIKTRDMIKVGLILGAVGMVLGFAIVMLFPFK